MKGSGLRYGLAWLLIFFVLSTPFFVGVIKSSPGTRIFIDPPKTIDSNLTPGKTFTVDVKVAEASGVHRWIMWVDWFNPSIILNVNPPVVEGGFLKGFGETTFYVDLYQSEGWMEVGCSLTVPSGTASGDGTLATITFVVVDRGDCWIGLEAILYDTADPPNEIYHYGYVMDTAYFRNVQNLYLKPSNITKNPGETFTVDLKIANITNLYAWGVYLSWHNPVIQDWLEATKFVEGEFLKRGGYSTMFPAPTLNNIAGEVYISCTRLGAFPGETGSGTLATITFKVKKGGNCTLDLYNTKLLTPVPNPYPPPPTILVEIPHTVEDGYFYTTCPLAYFDYSPTSPAVNQIITFDAAKSYDPDGGTLTNYRWDFGDGNVTTVITQIITHAYTKKEMYTVRLNVTDNEGKQWTYSPEPINVRLRDIAVTSVTAFPTKVKAGVLVNVDVTVKNLGELVETFNATAYYFNATLTRSIDTKTDTLNVGASKTLKFSWDTTGLSLGEYTIKAEAVISFDSNPTDNKLVNGNVTIAPVTTYDFPVAVGGITFRVIVETNSSVSSFTFNQAQKEIGFDVSGPSGMYFCNITIPRMLLDGDFTVLIDANPVAFTLTQNTTHSFVYFTYTLSSTSHIQIRGTTVATPPTASFTFSPQLPYIGETVTFDASSSVDDVGIVSYSWDFGDGKTGTGIIATHTYSLAKTSTVTLTVTDNDGLKATTPKSLTTFWVYDAAITNVTVSPTTANRGEIVSINVTVAVTAGWAYLTIRVTVKFNDTAIGLPCSVYLSPGSSELVKFVWNTTDVPIGTYTIRAVAEVTKYGDLTDFPAETDITNDAWVYGDVTVQKLTSDLFISASPLSFTVGESTFINGSIRPKRVGAEVKIWYRLSGSETWALLKTELTNATSEYSYPWTPGTAGTYELKASWEGDDFTLRDESDLLTITVGKMGSTISLDVSPSSVIVGSSVTISGGISPARAGVDITIQYSRDGGAWTTFTTVPADPNGHYSHNWAPSETGTYELKASWAGDVNTLGDESEIKTLTVQAAPINILLYVAVGAGIAIVLIMLAVYFLRRPKTGVQT